MQNIGVEELARFIYLDIFFLLSAMKCGSGFARQPSYRQEELGPRTPGLGVQTESRNSYLVSEVPMPEAGIQRFVDAQAPVYKRVKRELAAACKQSHWMWFVFPQLRGLGRSATAEYFGIASKEEAEAFATHPLLGTRLRECAGLVLAARGMSALEIFGSPDDLKLKSSMTLFEAVAPGEPAYAAVLDAFYAGARDDRTLALLQAL